MSKKKLISTIRGSRRGVLRGIGAGAIASAATLFAAKPEMAGAAPRAPQCCNLEHPPGDPNYIDYNDCHARASYIWGCAVSGSLYCTCCETAGNAQSSAQCLHS
ncbi:hypothetical protein AB0J86_32235 [Micromonospora sp. NPDC049559]|uniref:hypothetical protein n=1 Tax=Micromonospora sp. NPDC049559 TaxID=3155923 RepID=UPI00342B61DB